MPRSSRRRLSPLTVGLGTLATAGVIAAVLVVGTPSSGSTVRERTVTVAKGVVQSTVSGSGNLSPATQTELSFGASGRVTKVYVKAGQHVTTGQLLAKIDTADADVALAQARADLSSAQDTLTQIQSGTTTTSTAADTSTSASASATATTAMVPIASAAQATSGTPASTTTPPATTTPTPATRPSTTPTPATTTPSTTTSRGATTSGGGTARGSSGAAGSGSSSGSSGSAGSSGAAGSSGGGSTMSEASAAAAVESAQLAVDKAEQALAATSLRAPDAATVAAVNGAAGDQVTAGSSGTSGSGGSSSSTGAGAGAGGASATGSSSGSTSSGFITLTQLSRMHLDVSLSESDIGDVKVGQAATVTVNAASGEQVAGKVITIGVLSSSSSSGTSSAVSYPVTIALTQTTKGLRAGMTATADIVTAQSAGLVVPTQALRNGSVTVVKDGKRTTRRVETGVAGDSTTQVVSGLSAGDQVIVTSTSAAAGAAASGAAGAGARTGLGGGPAGAGGLGGGGGGFGGGGGGGGFGAGRFAGGRG